RQVDELARKAVDMEAHDAADVFAQIVASFAARLALTAGECAVHRHGIARLHTGDVGADRRDLARRFGAHHQWQLALGKRHAAKTPQVDMIERHRLDPDLYLAGRRRWRRSEVDQRKLAIRDQREGTHQAGSRLSTSETFWPPNPNELDSARRTRASRATLGTTSSGIAGSG